MQKYHVQPLTSINQSLSLQNDILLKLVKHIIVQVFSTNLGRKSLENCFLKGKTILKHKCIVNLFNQLLFTNCKKRWFLIIKRPKSSKNCFCYTSLFLTGSFATKKLNMELEKMFGLFLKGFFSSSFKGQLTFFSNFFKILELFELTCFLNAYTINCIYMTNLFLA